MRRGLYLFREALVGLRANRASTFIGVMTIAFTMASFGVFVLLFLNVRSLAGSFQHDLQVIVYVDDHLSSEDTAELQQALKQESAIETLTFISQKQALEDFHQQFPEESYLLDGIDQNPLPASIVATISQDASSSDAVAALAARVKKLHGVDHVRYGQDWVEWLTLFVSYLEFGAVLIGCILSVASVTIIASTIRLAFYTRRDDIEILRLIGATGTFIAIPYVVEGAVLGALGGGLSVGLLRGGFELFRQKIGSINWIGGLPSNLEFFPVQLSLLLVVSGLVLGCMGSLVSVYGWLRVRV